MRHHDAQTKFGRPRNQRTALQRSLARALILNEQIRTTEAKAKALRPFVERLVTQSATDSVAARRLVDSRLGGDAEATRKLFTDLGPRFAERAGGYTRITKVAPTSVSGRAEAIIEFVA